MYELVSVLGHIEVYQDGRFLFSADTLCEAYAELKKEAGFLDD